MKPASEVARAVLDKHWLDNLSGLVKTDLQAEITAAIIEARREMRDEIEVLVEHRRKQLEQQAFSDECNEAAVGAEDEFCHLLLALRALPLGDSPEGGPDSLLDSTAPQASVHGREEA